MNLLTRDTILAAQDVKYETVTVPEWGGDVRVRAISAAARDDLEQAAYAAQVAKQPFRNMRARMVALCVIDAEGKPVFTDADVDALGNKSAAALDRVYAVAARLNAMSNQDIDDLQKNLPAAPDGASNSGSPSASAKPSKS